MDVHGHFEGDQEGPIRFLWVFVIPEIVFWSFKFWYLLISSIWAQAVLKWLVPGNTYVFQVWQTAAPLLRMECNDQ